MPNSIDKTFVFNNQCIRTYSISNFATRNFISFSSVIMKNFNFQAKLSDNSCLVMDRRFNTKITS